MKSGLKSLLLGLGMSASVVSFAAAETVLRYTEGGPNRGTRAKAVQFFADEVARISKGDMKVEVHWGGALIKWKAALKGIAVGSADLGSVISAYAPKEMQPLAIGDLPVGNSNDAWVGMRAMYELMTTNKQLEEAMAKQNVVYLSNFHTTGVQLQCKGSSRIDSVADIKGKKMRASGIYAKALNDLGANMVSLTYGKVYQAYDSGLLDCDAGYFYANRAYKLYEVVDQVIRTDWGQVAGFGILMNKDIWGDLTKDQQAILRQAGSNMVDHFAQTQIETLEGTVADMESGKIGRKLDISQMSTEERTKLFDAGQKYVHKWAEDFSASGYDGKATFANYKGLLEKYTSERDSKGYPWAR